MGSYSILCWWPHYVCTVCLPIVNLIIRSASLGAWMY